MNNTANFIFEAFHLKRIQRSGAELLGTPSGTIAEHTYLTCIIGLVLAVEEHTDSGKVILMSLLHDLPEARMGDANSISKRYQYIFEHDAITDLSDNLNKPLQKIITSVFTEYFKQHTVEAQVVHDADILEQLVSEKIAWETGNTQAKRWMTYSQKRLLTTSAKKLASKLIHTATTEWWMRMQEKTPPNALGKIRQIQKIARERK